MKHFIVVVIAFLMAIFLINLSIKIFNTLDPWLGIGCGCLSFVAIVFYVHKHIKNLMKDEQ